MHRIISFSRLVFWQCSPRWVAFCCVLALLSPLGGVLAVLSHCMVFWQCSLSWVVFCGGQYQWPNKVRPGNRKPRRDYLLMELTLPEPSSTRACTHTHPSAPHGCAWVQPAAIPVGLAYLKWCRAGRAGCEATDSRTAFIESFLIRTAN